MSLAYSQRYDSYSPVVSTDTFNVTFPIFSADDLRVYVDGVETLDFSVSATFAGGRSDDASVVLDAAVSGVDVEIYGAKAPARATSYLPSSPNLAENLQFDVDVLTAIVQEQVRDTLAAIAVAQAAQAAVNGVAADAASAAASASAASTSAAAALAAENSLLEWAGAWLTLTDYAPSDLVQESGNAYVCEVPHTSGTFATDLAAGKWSLFVSKGASGAGSGDVLAANNGSDFASDVTFRANLKVPGRLTASVGSDDFDSDYDSRETSMFQVQGSPPLNGPAGGLAGDWVSWFRTDSNNIRAVWYLNDGSFATRTKVSGTWGDWIYHPTDDDLQAATPVAKVLFDGTVSPPTILYSKGIASVVRTGTGLYTVTWSNALASANSLVHASSNSHSCRAGGTRTTTSVNIINEDKNGTNENASFISVTIEGTLA